MATEDNNAERNMTHERYVRLGLKLSVDQAELNRNFDPALREIRSKLQGLSNDANLTKGIFGKDFFSNKAKELTGFNNELFTSIKNMMTFGIASKDGADQKKFYESLGFMGKGLVNLSDMFSKKAQAAKDAAKADKEAGESIADLGKQAENATGIKKLLGNLTGMGSDVDALGDGVAKVSKTLEKDLVPATKMATFSMEMFWTTATMGLAAVVTAILLVTKGMYQIFMQAVTFRDEMTKLDKMFGGVGSDGIAKISHSMSNLNKQMWHLGLSMEQVNQVVFDSVAQGLNFKRAISDKGGLVESVLTLSGATGVAAGEIGQLYNELLKTTKLDIGNIKEIGDGFIRWNLAAEKSSWLGQLSFDKFKEAITSSSTALGIASARGSKFTDVMTKDLTSLAGLANTLSLSISEINGRFEEAGSLLNSQDSPFRTLLVMSGGASFNDMLSNQFNKTDAMLKAADYLQKFNKSFGGNIQLTAQIAEKQFGLSKDAAIKLINMRKEAMDEMREADRDIEKLKSSSTREAYEKVTNTLSSMWTRVKTMFMTLLQNAFGGSEGVLRAVESLSRFLGRFKNWMENSTTIKKLGFLAESLSEILGKRIEGILDDFQKFINDFNNPDKNAWKTFFNWLGATLFKILWTPMWMLGQVMGYGIRSVFYGDSSSKGKARALKQIEKDSGMSLGSSSGHVGSNGFMSEHDTKLSNINEQKSQVEKQLDNLNKYSPDTVTYGKLPGDSGMSGYMTVGQKEDILREKQTTLQEQANKTLDDIKKNQEIAMAAGAKSGESKTAGASLSTNTPVGTTLSEIYNYKVNASTIRKLFPT